MEGIIGFEMEIERLEGKFKLGEERNQADRESVLKNLQAAKRERSIHDFTMSFYQRMKTSAG
jgi:predicted FMN-binding regulatory protein PaiB